MFIAVLSGLFFLTMLVLSKGLPSFHTTVFLVFSLVFLRLSMCWLRGNDEAFFILKALQGRVVRHDIIESVQWLHNVEGAGGPSKRLWFVLDDGQKVATPVVVGQAPRLSFGSFDVWLTPDQADALVADLDTRRRARRAEAQ
jgi:hypothetical protein